MIESSRAAQVHASILNTVDVDVFYDRISTQVPVAKKHPSDLIPDFVLPSQLRESLLQYGTSSKFSHIYIRLGLQIAYNPPIKYESPPLLRLLSDSKSLWQIYHGGSRLNQNYLQEWEKRDGAG